jgi:hypothetical protein
MCLSLIAIAHAAERSQSQAGASLTLQNRGSQTYPDDESVRLSGGCVKHLAITICPRYPQVFDFCSAGVKAVPTPVALDNAWRKTR